MNDWNIQSRAHACEECEQGFVDKQLYHTLLVTDAPDLVRKDLCDACWQDKFSADFKKREGFLSHWQGTYEPPPPTPPDAIQKSTAESLLKELVELNDPKYLAASYILAVMLERKRIIKVKDQVTEEGHRVFIYEHPKTGDVFTIPDPALQLNLLETVQRQVADLLEYGLAGKPPAPAPAPDTGEAEASDDQTDTLAAEEVVAESEPETTNA